MSKPSTVAAYFDALAPDRRPAMERLLAVIRAALPPGFKETIAYGMPGWVVPKSTYPAGYHVTPDQPLPFLSIASQKSHIAVYHMGIYANPELLNWFVDEYPKHASGKLNMGKSCIRFRNPQKIPFELIGELCSRMSPQQWIEIYEAALANR